MKKIICILISVFISGSLYAQFDNSSLTGPWFLLFGDSSAQYMIFDGQGTVTEAGFFGLPRPAGEYAVQSDGSFSGHIAADGALPITGQIYTDSTADLFVEIESQAVVFPLRKVKNVHLCQGIWAGEFKSDGAETGLQISVEIDSAGRVINGSGLAGPFDGGMFSQAGVVAGHFVTGESDGWYQIHMETAVIQDKTISGRFSIDCNDCPRGDFVMNWQPANIGASGGIGPSAPVLHENYPNPFNPSTTIGWTMPYSGTVQLLLFDTQGKIVRKFDNSQYSAGFHQIIVNARNMSSGVYFYRLTIKSSSGLVFNATKKCILIR